MRDFRDAKTMAHSLRQALDARSISITHSDALELIARSFGFDNWNILAAGIEAAKPAAAGPAGPEPLCCSFCGKSQHEVATLIAGPASHICNECVALCTDIIDEGVISDGLRQGGDERLDDYLRGRFPDRLTAYRPRLERWISHLDWSLAEAARALGEDVPAAPGSAPSVGRSKLADWPRERIEAHRRDLADRRSTALRAKAAADRLLTGEAPPPG